MKAFTPDKMHELFGYQWIDKPSKGNTVWFDSRTVNYQPDAAGNTKNPKTMVLRVGEFIKALMKVDEQLATQTGAGKVSACLHPPTDLV